MLIAEGLHKRFGERDAVSDVGFEIAAGEIYGLLGPNGAGKTTTISMITGVLPRDRGRVCVDGIDLDEGPAARRRIGLVPQAITLYQDLTARENLLFWGRMYELRGDALLQAVDAALADVGLADRANDRVATFSGGMQRRLNLVAGLLHGPGLLTLDEPTAGVDPQSRSAIFDLIERLRDQGMAILYTTHYMEEAERLCDRIGIIDGGRLIAEGTRRELIAQLGEESRIDLAFVGARAPERSEAIANALPDVRIAHFDGEHLAVHADDGSRCLPPLLGALLAAELAPSRIDVVEPDLEDVFLELTGRALRDWSGLRFAWVICLKDLRQRLRDRTAILVAVVVPLVIAGLVGVAFGSNQAGVSLRLVLVDLDRGPDADAMRAHLARPWLADVIEIEDADTPEAAEQVLADGDGDAALVLRAGFARAPAGHTPPPVEVLASGDNPFATRMTIALAEHFQSARALGADGEAATLPDLVPISPTGRLRPVDFFAFSMTVLFLTFTVLSGVRSLQQEVEAGTLARLIAAPTSARMVLAGKLLALMLTGWTQMAVMIASTHLLFGTRWGAPLSVVCLVFTTVWMAIGLTSFFMSVARNAEQGQMLASISIFLLAVIGGQFMPPQGLPDVFDTLQRLTPNGQAARGFVDAAALARDGGLAALWEPLLFTFAVGCAGVFVAGRRATRSLETALQ